MDTVGLRELRQTASAVVRRVEEGEEVEITVAGRPAARLVPIPKGPQRWTTWAQVSMIFDSPVSGDWDADMALIDQSLSNPWERE